MVSALLYLDFLTVTPWLTLSRSRFARHVVCVVDRRRRVCGQFQAVHARRSTYMCVYIVCTSQLMSMPYIPTHTQFSRCVRHRNRLICPFYLSFSLFYGEIIIHSDGAARSRQLAYVCITREGSPVPQHTHHTLYICLTFHQSGMHILVYLNFAYPLFRRITL